MRRPPHIRFGFDRFSGLYLWGIFIVVFSFWQPGLFPTITTVHLVASQQAISAIVAVGLMIPLVAGEYDLSIGAVANFAAILAISLQSNHGWSMWPAIVVTLLASVACGAVNGFIIVRLKVSSFIATLGMGTVITAVQIIVSDNAQPVSPTSQAWVQLTQRQVFGFQIVFVYMLVIACLVWWFVDLTPGGRFLRAIGGSREAARLSGVKTGKWIWISFVLSSLLGGVAGVLYGSLNGPSLIFGQALLLPAFAAAFLGSTQLVPGRLNIWGTVIAIYLLATGVQGLEYVTSVQWLTDAFNGVTLIAAVSFAVWRQLRKGATEGPGIDRLSEPASAEASTTEALG